MWTGLEWKKTNWTFFSHFSTLLLSWSSCTQEKSTWPRTSFQPFWRLLSASRLRVWPRHPRPWSRSKTRRALTIWNAKDRLKCEVALPPFKQKNVPYYLASKISLVELKFWNFWIRSGNFLGLKINLKDLSKHSSFFLQPN